MKKRFLVILMIASLLFMILPVVVTAEYDAPQFDLDKGTVMLNSGYEMPILGIGCYLLSQEQAENSVYWALKDGARLIDTARIYGNEEGVGRGIRRAIDEGFVTREEIFVTTKMWTSDFGHGDEAVDASLRRLSPPFENLRIVSDEEFDRCEALVKGRAPERPEKPVEPIQQGSRNLLTGLIFCGYCGNRLCYSHNKTRRKLADGTEHVYDRHLYRCYRRISSPETCEGPSAYEMDPINEAVEVAVRDYLNRISIIPREDLITLAGTREVKMAEAAYKQAVSEFNDAQRQVDALEAEALKALTGENQLDLGVVNSMLLKQKARLDAASKKKEEAKVLLEMEKNNKKANEVQVDEILSWASRFDDASYEAKHLVIAQLVDRIEIQKNDGYDITIHWRMTAEQFLGRKKEESA